MGKLFFKFFVLSVIWGLNERRKCLKKNNKQTNQVREQTGAVINVGDIIESEEDIENAIRMGKWLTEALIAKMQTHLQVHTYLTTD